MKKPLLAVAAWGGLLTAVNSACGHDWMLTTAPSNNWISVACSADGSRLIAVAAGQIYTSSNSGASWAPNTAINSAGNYWVTVAFSGNGISLLAGALDWVGFYTPSPIWVSTNAGTTWSPGAGASEFWRTIACSADGSECVAGSEPRWTHFGEQSFPLWMSTNAGTVWAATSAAQDAWHSVACSADGTKLFAATAGGNVYVSTNGGTSWAAPVPVGGSSLSLACSADGLRLVAASSGTGPWWGSLLLSTNAGASWVSTGAPQGDWKSVASSADGSRLVAVSDSDPYVSPGPFGGAGAIYTSADAGATWTVNNAPVLTWSAVASSADGCRLVAVASGGAYAYLGAIYTWQTTPHPVLNVTPAGTNLVLYWIIPSQLFVLQENADLTATNWSDVASAPVLNLTNLQNQVTLPLPAGNRFYRLKSR
jgi:hypothetical protein